MIIKGIAVILMLLIVPFFAGLAMCRLLKIKKSLAAGFVVGSFTEWAIIQIISVPLIIFRCSFLLVVILVSVLLALLCIYGIFVFLSEREKIKAIRLNLSATLILSIVLALGAYLYIAIQLYRMQYVSYDDSRFVVCAVDIVQTNRMFLTNPSTGAEISGFWGDMHRDVVSPWAVYIAYASKTTGIPVTIMAHTILPQTLLLCMVCVYRLIADAFFHGKPYAIGIMLCAALLVNVYGARDGWDAESFAMEILWQGKAVVAAIGIPALFLASIWIFHEPNGWKKYIFLYSVSFAMCLMSGMGIIISGLMIGAVGLVYGFILKKISVTMKTWIGLLAPLAYYAVSLLSY